VILLLAIGCAACGSADDGTVPGTAGAGGGPSAVCAPPDRVVDDACRAPGVQDDGCPAGTLGRGDGSCRPAGVPPELCGEGFAHDGHEGCEPILPSQACAPGELAVPGDSACRPVWPCAPGDWGDIPVEESTEHVDGSYPGADSDGSADRPWTTIGDALAAAEPGAVVAIAAGIYPEDVAIAGKPVVLWGVCPDEVAITGTGATPSVSIFDDASGTVLRGLAIEGGGMGVQLWGAKDVLLEGLWVHDTANRGIDIATTSGGSSCTLRSSLIEATHEAGVFVSAGNVSVEATAVRGTLPSADGLFGGGIYVSAAANVPSVVDVRGSVLEQNRDVALWVGGSQVTVESTVVRGTLMDGTGLRGRGISVQNDAASGAPSSAVVRGCLLDDNHDVGLFVAGSDARVEASVVRGTQPDTQETTGRGIVIRADPTTGAGSTATLRSSLVEQNHDTGMSIDGSTVDIEATVVRGTLSDDSGLFGVGVVIQDDPLATSPTVATLRASVIDDNREVGLHLRGAEATIEGSVVRATRSDEPGLFGRGVSIEPLAGVGPSTATIHSSTFEHNQEFGIVCIGSSVSVDGTLVRDNTGRSLDGSFGDGFTFVDDGARSISFLLTSSAIERSARAAVSSFGAAVSIGGARMDCNAIDLDGEPYFERAASFTDMGDNRCGCGDSEAQCTVSSAGLTPPEVPK